MGKAWNVQTGVLLLLVVLVWPWSVFGQDADSTSQALTPAFSKDAMSALADVYRWKEKARSDAKTSLSNPDAALYLRSVAYEHLRQAQSSAKTPGDEAAAALLRKHFADVNKWTTKLADARKNRDATNLMDPDSVDQDADLVKINDCEKAFNSMLGSAVFTEVASCQ
jgi:hypothetical protein